MCVVLGSQSEVCAGMVISSEFLKYATEFAKRDLFDRSYVPRKSGLKVTHTILTTTILQLLQCRFIHLT